VRKSISFSKKLGPARAHRQKRDEVLDSFATVPTNSSLAEWPAPWCSHFPSRPRKYFEKIVLTYQGVQLIVFFGWIREILKREIYKRDKDSFCLLKTKAIRAALDDV
jgi:hypothetical protein